MSEVTGNTHSNHVSRVAETNSARRLLLEDTDSYGSVSKSTPDGNTTRVDLLVQLWFD